jgi:hypothetical protein
MVDIFNLFIFLRQREKVKLGQGIKLDCKTEPVKLSEKLKENYLQNWN